jgi:hypothetical protein
VAYRDIADLAQHPGFRLRVRVAMVQFAISVAVEVDNATERTRLRRAHMVNVLSNQEFWNEHYAWAVASDPAVSFNSNDAVLLTSVNGKFDAMAGAPPA